MSTRKMLIDAAHSEETRVVVLNGNRLEELDVESASRKILKGNIYLAKVARVEPSLQAAFVDYGGNRHGFLPFSEIHPDYYQIPVADREALIAEERRETQSLDNGDKNGDGEGTDVEVLGGDDDDDVRGDRPTQLHRKYKIQEVIKRRQILLVQVVKEERGSKGAALTTYLSLAGRYCVLMPNTPRGGGISRKIANSKDRRRLRSILNDLEIPEGMAIIVRTAGAERTKAEIRRDYEYLLRLWNTVRDTTLDSFAPCLVYEEANLIKRSIRDLYGKDIDEVIVEGESGYRAAKDFMKMLMPSHAKKVKLYKDEAMPLFHRFQVEGYLDGMHSPTVQLRSGGYLVINPTEALVAIDVNSGRSTRERSIEETALRTNLEAAEEIARQLRLRDLAGLIVIDFIDMEVHRNQNQVERKLKESMRNDRARIQIGRISPFGLLELSRQRLRPSLLETSTETCPFCAGTGVRRSTESTVLHVLRAIEEEGIRQRTAIMEVHVPNNIAFYLLNQKRQSILDVESRYGTEVKINGDDSLIAPDYRLERLSNKTGAEADPEVAKEAVREETTEGEEEPGRKKRRRRRGRKRKSDVETMTDGGTEATIEQTTEQVDAAEAVDDGETDTRTDDEDSLPRKRRRGRRGGRKRRRGDGDDDAPMTAEGGADQTETQQAEAEQIAAEQIADVIPDAVPVAAESATSLNDVDSDETEPPDSPADETLTAEAPPQADDTTTESPAEPAKKPRSRRRRKTTAEKDADAQQADQGAAEEEAQQSQGEPASASPPPTDGSTVDESPAENDSGVEAQAEIPSEEAPAAKKKPARRTKAASTTSRSRRKKASDEEQEPAAEEKPKRRTPRRRKATAESEVSTEDSTGTKDSEATAKDSGATALMVAEPKELMATETVETSLMPMETPETALHQHDQDSAPETKPEPAAVPEDHVVIEKQDGTVETVRPEKNARRGWWQR